MYKANFEIQSGDIVNNEAVEHLPLNGAADQLVLEVETCLKTCLETQSDLRPAFAALCRRQSKYLIALCRFLFKDDVAIMRDFMHSYLNLPADLIDKTLSRYRLLNVASQVASSSTVVGFFSQAADQEKKKSRLLYEMLKEFQQGQDSMQQEMPREANTLLISYLPKPALRERLSFSELASGACALLIFAGNAIMFFLGIAFLSWATDDKEKKAIRQTEGIFIIAIAALSAIYGLVSLVVNGLSDRKQAQQDQIAAKPLITIIMQLFEQCASYPCDILCDEVVLDIDECSDDDIDAQEQRPLLA